MLPRRIRHPPHLRRTGPSRVASTAVDPFRHRERRDQIVRERRADVDRLGSDRVHERQPGRVQELPRAGRSAAVRRTGDRRTPDGRSRPCAPGSDGCDRCRARPAGGLRPRETLDQLEVGARLLRLVGIDRHQHCDRVGCARSARRSCPIWPAARRRQRQVLAAQRPCAISSFSARWTASLLAIDEQPRGVPVKPVDDPGPPRILAAGGASRERLRQRARPVTAAGVHDHSRRLVDDHQVRVLVRDPERGLRLAHAPARDSIESSTSTPAPGCTSVALRDTRPSTRTRPASISAGARGTRAERDREQPVKPGAGRRIGDA